MVGKAVVPVVLLGVLLLPGAAWAQLPVDDFESYALNSVIYGQNYWTGWGGPAQAQELVVNIVAHSGEQSLQIASPDADVVHQYANLDSGMVEFSSWQYIPSSEVEGNTYYILLNRFVNPSGPFGWSSQLTFNLANGTVREAMHQTSAEDGGVDNTLNILRDQWVEIKHNINLDTDWVDIYYGGQLLASDEWSNGGALALRAIDLYGPNGTVYYDDVMIPEPTSLAILALGAGVLLRRRR